MSKMRAIAYARKRINRWADDIVEDFEYLYGGEFRVIDIHKSYKREFDDMESYILKKYKFSNKCDIRSMLNDILIKKLSEDSRINIPFNFANEGFLYWNLSLDIIMDSYEIDDYIKRLLYSILRKEVISYFEEKTEDAVVNFFDNVTPVINFSHHEHRKIYALMLLNGYTFKDIERRLYVLAEFEGFHMETVKLILDKKLAVKFTTF